MQCCPKELNIGLVEFTRKLVLSSFSKCCIRSPKECLYPLIHVVWLHSVLVTTCTLPCLVEAFGNHLWACTNTSVVSATTTVAAADSGALRHGTSKICYRVNMSLQF